MHPFSLNRTTEHIRRAMKQVRTDALVVIVSLFDMITLVSQADDRGAGQTFMSQDEFITTAVNAFIDKVL